jgi:hypothetical protein
MQEIFEEYFEYSEHSPSGLIWKVDIYSGKNNTRKMKSIGDFAGYLRYKKSGKIDGWIVGLNRKCYSVHRIICILNGLLQDTEMVVDHIDGNPSNNILSNLRVVDHKTNLQNCSISQNNKSGITGVHYNSYLDCWVGSSLENGSKIRKSYSCKKYGDTLAKELAIKFRNDTIKLLNSKGMNYTERHGK